MVDQIYTLEEAAKVLKLHKETLRLKAKRNQIDGFRIGNEWRFTESDIQEFIDKQRNK
jgi:excisionase family DNA binding protein